MRRFVLILLLAGCPFTPSGPPAPDSCDHGATGSISAIEIGTANENAFVPYHDRDVAEVQRGGQGANMMGLRLRLTGSDVPSCIAQTTRYGGGADGSSGASLKTYAQPDGTRTTSPLWIPGSFVDPFTVTTTIGGAAKTISLRYDPSYYPGAPDLSTGPQCDPAVETYHGLKCSFGVDTSCHSVLGYDCTCRCDGYWECDQVFTICDGGARD